MFAPRLRNRITIQSATWAVDSLGEPIATWASFAADIAAAAEPTRGREFFAAEGIHAEAPMLFVIRYKSGVTPLMRVVYDGDTWEIKSVVDFRELHREMHLYCIGLDLPVTAADDTNYRLTEAGDIRLTEAGDYRLTEAA